MEKAMQDFERYLNRRYRGRSTAKHYMSDLRIFIGVVGERTPEAVTPVDVDRFVDSQIAAGMSAATINRRLASVHSFFEYLAAEDLTRVWPNPVIWRRHGMKEGEHLPRDVPDQDVARLFEVIEGARDRAMFGLMVGAGLRVGEVTGLLVNSLEAPREDGQLARLRVLGKGDKERMVWCVPSLWAALEAWLAVRAPVDHDRLFLNQHGEPITVSGVQYGLKQYCQVAGVAFTCHQLRHTFGRRMTENGLPIDSLAKLLGHAQLRTTQRYIDGADIAVRADFAAAMAQLENDFEAPPVSPVAAKPATPVAPRERVAPQEQLERLRGQLSEVPPWLAEALDAYFTWRWPSWRAQNAYELGMNYFNVIRRFWEWIDTHRSVTGWTTLHRADLAAWLEARCQSGVKVGSIQAELGQVRRLLRFLEVRDCPLDPGLFRVKPPRDEGPKLPRYLPEATYRQLEQTLLASTQEDAFYPCVDRAWFLMLAHTGIRIGELRDLRLGDLDLINGAATVRDGKGRRDRVVFLSPPLVHTLQRYLVHRPNVETDHVFLLKGHPPSTNAFQWRLDKYTHLAGISHVTLHQLRHTFATRLLNAGMPIQSLRKLLGHKHLTMTQRYARVYDQTLYTQFQQAISQLEAIPISDWPHPSINHVEKSVHEDT